MNKIVSFSLGLFLTLACIPLTLQSASNIALGSSNLQLNGIAIQSELRSDWFINALYLAQKSDNPEAILSEVNPKRMEIKVLADQLSGRRLKRFWVERIRNNNEPGAVLALAKQVRDFANIMGQGLQANDVISIDFLPGDTTRVNINGTEQANLSPDLFNLILRSWIGERPPSNEFKAAILGKTNFDTLLSRYQAIQPSEARVLAFDQKRQNAIAEQQRLEEEKRLAEQRRLEQQQRAQQALVEQQRLEQQRLAQQAKDAEQQRQAELKKQQEEARLAEEAAKKPPVVEVPAGPTPEEIAALKNNYTKSITRHYSPYFEYPQRALLRKHGVSAFNRPKKGKTHGTVSVNVEVDRDGDFVSGGLAKSSGEKILDDAVLKALFDAVPFPPMPDELKDETFSTTLSISIPPPSF